MLRAKETIHVATKEGVRTVTPQDLIEDGDGIVKGREGLFETVGAEQPKTSRGRRPAAKKTGD